MAELKSSTEAAIRQMYSAPVRSLAEDKVEQIMYTVLGLEGPSFPLAAQKLVMDILHDIQVNCTKTALMLLSVPDTLVRCR